jgi:hypothetical protein
MRLLHIGRATSNDIVIADTTVSRQHAQLMVDDQGYVTLIDLSSSNGTFVNGRRISSPTRLDQTDIVKVGEYLLPWRQHVQASSAAQASGAVQGAREAASAGVAEAEGAAAPVSRKALLYILGGGIAVAVVVVIVVAIWAFGSIGHGNLVGKWYEKENGDAWIHLEENGNYTEGFKDAVVFDHAKWQAMRTDRLLIEKDDISISKRFKFEGKYLKITYLGKTVTYEREE